MAQKKEEQGQKPEKKTCFVIMPFSDPEGYERGHFRSIYEYTFVPAIRAAGYEPLRIDDNSVSNLIHGKMMNELINAPMVLCDLSTNNPNVLYELGIRHAYDKPVVLVQEIGQDRIFDIGAITSVEYHPTRLYEEVVEDQQKITEAILQTANAKNTYSIMSLAMLQSAQPASGSVTSADQVQYLMQEVAQMSRRMSNLEKKQLSNTVLIDQTLGSEKNDSDYRIFYPLSKSHGILKYEFDDKKQQESYMVIDKADYDRMRSNVAKLFMDIQKEKATKRSDVTEEEK